MPIPQDHALVARALRLIPARMHPRAWVGGSAASPYWPIADAHGADLDVWICEFDRLDREHSDFDDWIDLMKVDEIAEWHGGVDHSNLATDYPDGSTIHYSADRLQILSTPSSMRDTVDLFDMTCHAFARPLMALADDTEVIAHPEATSTGVANILNWNNPSSTLRRWFQFNKRYGFEPGAHVWDVNVLACARAIWGTRLDRTDKQVPPGL